MLEDQQRSPSQQMGGLYGSIEIPWLFLEPGLYGSIEILAFFDGSAPSVQVALQAFKNEAHS